MNAKFAQLMSVLSTPKGKAALKVAGMVAAAVLTISGGFTIDGGVTPAM